MQGNAINWEEISLIFKNWKTKNNITTKVALFIYLFLWQYVGWGDWTLDFKVNSTYLMPIELCLFWFEHLIYKPLIKYF